MSKRGRWCGKCKAIHYDECPERAAWVKPVRAESGRGGRPWRRLRAQVFRRDNYLCRACLDNGVYTSVEQHGPRAGICDHIVPLSEGGTDDVSNLQTLCVACSDAKTATESARGRARGSN